MAYNPENQVYNTPMGPRTVAQMRQELKVANYPNWQNAGEWEIVETYARTTKGNVISKYNDVGQNLPSNWGHVYNTLHGNKTAEQMRQELKTAGYPNWQTASEAEIVSKYAQTTGRWVGLSAAPMPYQINPMTWDSMSDTAKSLFLSMAELGQTKSGAWNKADYLNQFEASRPKGNAPQNVNTNFKKLDSFY